MVEYLTWEGGAVGLSLTSITVRGPWARHIYPSLVLVQPRKICPCLTERLLMGRKESIQTNKQQWAKAKWLAACQSLHFILSLRMNSSFITSRPGLIAQSVSRQTAYPGVVSLINVQSHTFVEIDHEIILLSFSLRWFKKSCWQLQAEVYAWSTG